MPTPPDAPLPDDAAPGASDPSEEELAHAREGRVRRAPRFRAFVQAGVVVGVVLGVLAALVLPAEATEAGRGTVAVFTGLAGAVAGAVVGAALAVLADRRS
ncbi:histidine kinase [Actinotalea solisilvae]|uniref:histidine kinase n=1 Tax=Actinotalea solisilvae TaxID=2072922 RepID=UPI0027DE6F50|nr:histidine kinase [Actinotalea solisilvae]